MIVSCAGCGTKYRVSDDKIGPLGVKVRCPKCRTVFEVKHPEEEQPESLAEKLFGKDVVVGQPPVQPESATQAPLFAGGAPPSEQAGVLGSAVEAEPAGAAVLPGDAPAAEPAERRPTFPFRAGEEEPRTLARALVSDILFYNRDSRDRGIAEGKILACLGKEIARSWDTYKERVGLEKAVETDFFRQAVNEILGEGRDVL